VTRFSGEQDADFCTECESILVPGEGDHKGRCMGCADGANDEYADGAPAEPRIGPTVRGPADYPGWMRSGRHG
jgi:hypothetical protein